MTQVSVWELKPGVVKATQARHGHVTVDVGVSSGFLTLGPRDSGHSSIVHNSRKADPKCPSMEGWINKMWSTHTMGYYYSALKGVKS